MCQDCGCDSSGTGAIIKMIGEETSECHDHSHHHDRRELNIRVEEDILQKNNLMAGRNRSYLAAKNVLALNLVSSPGSGKTSLLEKTINDMKTEMDFFVIEGDQQTMNDALRIDKTGVPVVQINTGSGCHLDADMVYKAIGQKFDGAPTQPSNRRFCVKFFKSFEGLTALRAAILWDLQKKK